MRQVVKFPNPILKKKCNEVSFPLSSEILSIVNEMKKIAKDQEALGIAANQLGSPLRIFYLKTRHHPGGLEEVFVNPTIYKKIGSETSFEGCLSFDNLQCLVERAKTIWIKYKDVKGLDHDIVLTGLSARCAQHETDHLDGIVFTEKDMINGKA